MTDELTQRKHWQELHANYMAELNRREATTVNNYDKALLAYSTGALGLSITFGKELVTDMAKATDVWSLKVAWTCWVLTVFLTLGSFLVAVPAGRIEADKATRYFLWPGMNGPDPNVLLEPNPWLRMLPWLNLGSGLTFVLGALAMVIFAWSNIHEGTLP